MNTKHLTLLVTCLFLTVCVAPANAAHITFIHEGRASGTIGATPFTDKDFTITAMGDTTTRFVGFLGVLVIPHNLASIEIDGIGTFDFITATETFVANFNQIVGVHVTSSNDLFNGPIDPAFATWDMLTPIGPISANNAHIGAAPPISTSGGILSLAADSDIPATFLATLDANPIPAPGALVLVLTGVVSLSGFHRRHRRKTD